MKPTGTQHSVEFQQCVSSFLKNATLLETILREGLNHANLSHVQTISHQFTPVGVTVLAIVRESHIAIHTYPETAHVSIDIFTCSDSQKHLRLLEYLQERFQPQSVHTVELQRGIPLAVKNKSWYTASSSEGFAVRYDVSHVIAQQKSDFHLIDIIQNPAFGKMLFLDKRLQIAEKDIPYFKKLTGTSILKPNIKYRKIAINGVTMIGLIPELTKAAETVYIIDHDQAVIDLVNQYLFPNIIDQPGVELIFGNFNEITKHVGKFDVVFSTANLPVMPDTQLLKNSALETLFLSISEKMVDDGKMVFFVGSITSHSKQLIEQIAANYFSEVELITTYIPSFIERQLFCIAKK